MNFFADWVFPFYDIIFCCVDRSTLVNSDSEQDSGHCDASEVYGTDIDSVMVPMFAKKFEEKTYRHLHLVRSNSDVTDVNNITPSEHRKPLARALSSVETTHLSVPATNGLRSGMRSPAGSPKLAHMKMTSTSSSIKAGSCLPNVDFLARKSDLSEGYRYYNGELIDIGEDMKPAVSTGRKYLFQGLLAERSSLWDNMEFWEYLFMDVVAAERDTLGMNQNLGEMIERYVKSLCYYKGIIVGKSHLHRLLEDLFKYILLNTCIFLLVDMTNVPRR